MRIDKPAVSEEQLRRVWQNRQPRREPVRLGSLVRALVRAERLDKPSPLVSLRGSWEELVGLELSGHSRLAGLKRGTLRVEVDSAAHMVELKGLVQAGLAQQLNERSEDRAVKVVRLRLASRNIVGGRRRLKLGRDKRRGSN